MMIYNCLYIYRHVFLAMDQPVVFHRNDDDPWALL